MRRCCIDGCDVLSKKDVTLFEFPTSRLLRKRWLDAINPASKLAVDAMICSQHFAADDYEDFRGKVRLKSKVVPTLFGYEVSIPPVDPLGIGDDKVTQTSKNDNHDGNVDNCNEHVDNVDKNAIETENPNKDTTENGHNEINDNNSENVDKNNEDVDQNIENNDISNSDVVSFGNGNVENTNFVNKTKKVKKKWVPMRNIAAMNGHLDSESSQDSINSDLPAPPILEDLEEHLPNYQIANMKTERQIAAMTETLDPVEETPMDQDIEEIVMEPHIPVFIELSVGQDTTTTNLEEQPNDCLMVLESVQCDIDPTLMLQARAEDEECCEQIDLDDDDDDDDDVQEVDVPAAVDPVKTPKKAKPSADPISLLTSSDEDDVILQEPHIDTLSVSDETDEDDLPLQKLIKKTKKESKKTKKKKKSKPEPFKRVLCAVPDYFCTRCQHTSPDSSAHHKHLRTHKHEEDTPPATTKVYQICKECGFTTSSKSQLHRHQRKHLNEKKYKCPLCSYRSKYNMSLMYHLKTHDFDPNMYNCGACGLELDNKKALLEHQKSCSAMDDKYICSVCGYVGKDKRVMKIHRNTVHKQRA